MTEENKTVELKEETCKCFCKSEWFKKFLTKTLAVFVGVYCALSLFAALHKPPMPPCPFAKGPMMTPPCHHKMHHFSHHRSPRAEFHRKMEKREFKKFEKGGYDQKMRNEIQAPQG